MTETTTSAVSLEIRDDVAIVTLDDGGVNAMSYQLLSEAREVFAQAVAQASAVVIAGNAKCLSAGFDLKEVVKGPEQRDAIIGTGGMLFHDILTCPRPVVIACTGHAVAGGLVYLLVGDVRIGRPGLKVGFNEVLIGVPMPEFGISLAQYRLSPMKVESVLLGDMYTSDEGVEFGLFDSLVDGDAGAVIEAAVARAKELGARPGEAYAITKARARRGLIEEFKAAVDAAGRGEV